LINPDFETISSGSYTWENQLKELEEKIKEKEKSVSDVQE